MNRKYSFIYRKYSFVNIQALLFTLILALLPSIRVSAEPVDYQAEAEARKGMTVESNERENWPDGPIIGAQSAILMEAQTGAILYEKNVHDKLYPASITKILTGLITMEECPLSDTVSYSHRAVDSINFLEDSNIGIRAGEALTVEQSLYALLVGSANEAGNALGEHISGSMESFVERMNERASRLGCVDSHFVTTNGIFDENHYTSAYDMALIGRAFFSNNMLCKISSTESYTFPVSPTLSRELYAHSKNQLLPGKDYAYEYLVGSKTGYTSEARQTLVSCAQKDGMRLICVIMKEESPAQFTDTIDLFNYGFGNFHMVNVADVDQKYTFGSNSFFESDNPIFGDASPILSIDPTDMIVLPNTAEYEDADSVLTYDDSEDGGIVARIDYTCNGVPVGSATLNLAQRTSSPGVLSSTGRPDASRSGQIYINVRYVLIALAIVAGALFLLFYLISLAHNYQFGRKRRERAQRRRRHRRSDIDLDRYTGSS